MEFYEWIDSFLALVLQLKWIRIIAFALFGVWLFSFLLWDFVLSIFKQYELLRKHQSNVFDFKREVQTFLLMIVLIGWGFYYLYGWFDKPDLGTWLIGGAVLLLSVWANRSLSTRWLVAVWESLDDQQRKTIQQDPFVSEED